MDRESDHRNQYDQVGAIRYSGNLVTEIVLFDTTQMTLLL